MRGITSLIPHGFSYIVKSEKLSTSYEKNSGQLINFLNLRYFGARLLGMEKSYLKDG